MLGFISLILKNKWTNDSNGSWSLDWITLMEILPCFIMCACPVQTAHFLVLCSTRHRIHFLSQSLCWACKNPPVWLQNLPLHHSVFVWTLFGVHTNTDDYQETQGHFPSPPLLRFCQNGARASEDSESAQKCQEAGRDEEGQGPRSKDGSKGCTCVHLPCVQGEYLQWHFSLSCLCFFMVSSSSFLSSSWNPQGFWEVVVLKI